MIVAKEFASDRIPRLPAAQVGVRAVRKHSQTMRDRDYVPMMEPPGFLMFFFSINGRRGKVKAVQTKLSSGPGAGADRCDAIARR